MTLEVTAPSTITLIRPNRPAEVVALSTTRGSAMDVGVHIVPRVPPAGPERDAYVRRLAQDTVERYGHVLDRLGQE